MCCRSKDEKSQKYHLMRAAHLFFQCKKAMKAEKCLRIASQYKCLGRFYERTQQVHVFLLTFITNTKHNLAMYVLCFCFFPIFVIAKIQRKFNTVI